MCFLLKHHQQSPHLQTSFNKRLLQVRREMIISGGIEAYDLYIKHWLPSLWIFLSYIGQVKYLLNIWCKICAYWTPAPPCHYELMYRAPMRAKNYRRIKKFTNFSSEITLLAYTGSQWFSAVWVFAQRSRNFELAVYCLLSSQIRSLINCWPYTCVLSNPSFAICLFSAKHGLPLQFLGTIQKRVEHKIRVGPHGAGGNLFQK